MEKDKKDDYVQVTKRFSLNRNVCLGEGTYGKAFKGWDQERLQYIAVKWISRKTLGKLNGLEQRQIDVMAKLKHQNVLGYFGCYRTQKDGLFLFLQLCEKGCLSTYLEKNHLTEAQSLVFLKQIVEGMAYINSNGYFHRDLKPDNLLLTKDNVIKIADFGTAKEYTGNTKNTYRKCTPIYSAPEVYQEQIYKQLGENYNKKCDVFSVGYILYEMLAGQELTKGISTHEELGNFLRLKRESGFNFDHMPAWKPILLKLLDFNVESRATFFQIQAMLKGFKPSEKAFPLPSLSSQQIKYSASLRQEVVSSINNTEKSNNYHVGLLKVLNYFQDERSDLIPRVYKLLALYFSLGRYCRLADQILSDLLTPGSIEIKGKKMELQMDKLFIQDRQKLFEFIETKAHMVNTAIEQIRSIVLRQIIPGLQDILKLDNRSPEREVVQQYLQQQNLESFKRREYISNLDYINRYNRCLKSIFKTRAQTFVLSNSDLKTYLVMLILSRKQVCVPEKKIWPIRVFEVLQLNRQQLLVQVSNLKVELNL